MGQAALECCSSPCRSSCCQKDLVRVTYGKPKDPPELRSFCLFLSAKIVKNPPGNSCSSGSLQISARSLDDNARKYKDIAEALAPLGNEESSTVEREAFKSYAEELGYLGDAATVFDLLSTLDVSSKRQSSGEVSLKRLSSEEEAGSSGEISLGSLKDQLTKAIARSELPLERSVRFSELVEHQGGRGAKSKGKKNGTSPCSSAGAGGGAPEARSKGGKGSKAKKGGKVSTPTESQTPQAAADVAGEEEDLSDVSADSFQR